MRAPQNVKKIQKYRDCSMDNYRLFSTDSKNLLFISIALSLTGLPQAHGFRGQMGGCPPHNGIHNSGGIPC